MKRTIDADRILLCIAIASAIIFNVAVLMNLRDRLNAIDIKIKALETNDSSPYIKPNLILPIGIHWVPRTTLVKL